MRRCLQLRSQWRKNLVFYGTASKHRLNIRAPPLRSLSPADTVGRATGTRTPALDSHSHRGSDGRDIERTKACGPTPESSPSRHRPTCSSSEADPPASPPPSLPPAKGSRYARSEEHTSELQSRGHLVC